MGTCLVCLKNKEAKYGWSDISKGKEIRDDSTKVEVSGLQAILRDLLP